jgi:hypothetical protein
MFFDRPMPRPRCPVLRVDWDVADIDAGLWNAVVFRHSVFACPEAGKNDEEQPRHALITAWMARFYV